MMPKAHNNSPGRGQFKAKYSENSLPAFRIATQSTATAAGVAKMFPALCQFSCFHNVSICSDDNPFIVLGMLKIKVSMSIPAIM